VDKQEIGNIFGLIITAYENIKLTEEKLSLWAELLADLDYQATLTATKKYIQANKFPPTIADIRNYYQQPEKPKEIPWWLKDPEEVQACESIPKT